MWLIVSMVSLEWSALLLLVVFDVVAVEMEEKSRFRSLKTAPEESTVAVRGSPSAVSRVLMVVVSQHWLFNKNDQRRRQQFAEFGG